MADLIVLQATEARINPAFMLALAVTESSLNPDAIGDDGLSIGLFQLKERTARQWRPNITREQLFDAPTNAQLAMAQMAWIHRTYPGRTYGDYAEAWALGAKGRFERQRRYFKKLEAMRRAIVDLELALMLDEVWA